MADAEEPIVQPIEPAAEKKPRKPKSEAQLAAFNKARQVRYENMRSKKAQEGGVPPPRGGQEPVPVLKKAAPIPIPKPKKVVEQESDDDEPQVVIVKKKKKPQIIYQEESEDDEPVVRKPRPKTTRAPPAAKPAPKAIEPVAKKTSNDFSAFFR